MKIALFLFCIALLPAFCFADAGFNIGRPKAPCYAVFKGMNSLTGFEFYKISKADERKRGEIMDTAFTLHENDSLKLYYTKGRRYWQGPLKILIRNKNTQQFVDSFTLIAEGYNLIINFSGQENDKPKYTIEKIKAEYPYSLYGNENVDQAMAKRNKYILISMSAIGLLLLLFMIFKRKKNSIQKTA